MAYRKQYFEWQITAQDLLTGIPVGFEVELSPNSRFYPITKKLSTFDETYGEKAVGKFFYSLDNGKTWIDYPVGESGETFNQPFMMRLEITEGDTSSIFAIRGETIYRLSGSGQGIIDTYTNNALSAATDIVSPNANGVLGVLGENLYRFDTNQRIKSHSPSIELSPDLLGIGMDYSRNSFWEITRNQVNLRNGFGEIQFAVLNPLSPVDWDYSSSSSMSSGSSWSSDSTSSSSIDSSSSTSSLSSLSSGSSDSSDSSPSSDSSLSSDSSDSSPSSDSSLSEAEPRCMSLQVDLTEGGLPVTETFYFQVGDGNSGSEYYYTIGLTRYLIYENGTWVMWNGDSSWRYFSSITDENASLVGSQALWTAFPTPGDTIDLITCLD